MARRVQTLVKTEYVQTLKAKFYEKTLLTKHSQVLTKLSYIKPKFSDYKIRSWAKFESDNFDGIQLIAGLFLQNSPKTCGTCTFKIYAISTDDNWTETLIATLSGTEISGKRFKASLSEASLAPLQLTGEVSFRVEVELTRVDKTYKDFFYVNHIGIFGEVFILKKDVKFLELTKLDE